MEIKVCKDPQDWTKAAHDWCADSIARLHVKNIFVPAGNTPLPLYRYWSDARPDYLAGRRLLQVDDVLTGPKAGMFKRFFEEHLPQHQSQLVGLGDGARTAELCLLGLGLNGHVAFHEPEVAPDFYSGCVKLSRTTCDNLGVDQGTWGISYGVSAFLKSQAILLLVRGEQKRGILNEVLSGSTCPAGWLKDHEQLTILTDFDI